MHRLHGANHETRHPPYQLLAKRTKAFSRVIYTDRPDGTEDLGRGEVSIWIALGVGSEEELEELNSGLLSIRVED